MAKSRARINILTASVRIFKCLCRVKFSLQRNGNEWKVSFQRNCRSIRSDDEGLTLETSGLLFLHGGNLTLLNSSTCDNDNGFFFFNHWIMISDEMMMMMMMIIMIPQSLRVLTRRPKCPRTMATRFLITSLSLALIKRVWLLPRHYTWKQLHSRLLDIRWLIIHMKKLLDSDWLRAVQFKCNTSAKSVTPVQKV